MPFGSGGAILNAFLGATKCGGAVVQSGLFQNVGWRVYTMGKFEELYRKHVQAVFRFALHCVGRREVAEDLTSEAFLALYRNLDTIDEALLPGWLITVTRNRARVPNIIGKQWNRCIKLTMVDNALPACATSNTGFNMISP